MKNETVALGFLIIISFVVYPFLVPPIAKTLDKQNGAGRLERAQEAAFRAGQARADELDKLVKTMLAANDVLAQKAAWLRNVAQSLPV